MEAGLCSNYRAASNSKPANLELLQAHFRKSEGNEEEEDHVPFNAALQKSADAIPTNGGASVSFSLPSQPRSSKKRTGTCPMKNEVLMEGSKCPGMCSDQCTSTSHVNQFCDGFLRTKVCKSPKKQHAALKGASRRIGSVVVPCRA